MRNELCLYYPSSFWTAKWRDALPTGNGKIGASVYGSVQHETILINHEGLWADVMKQPLPDISEHLPEFRGRMKKGEIVELQEFFAEKLGEKGYIGNIASPLPMLDLNIINPVTKAFKEYRRALDMETGEITVSWQDDGISFQRKLFVSRLDDMVVYNISSNHICPKAFEIYLSVHDPDNAYKPFGHPTETVPVCVENSSDGEFLYFAASYKGGGNFGAVARIVISNGNGSGANGKAVITEENNLLIYIKLFIEEDKDEAFKRLRNDLESINRSYNSLLARHAEIHKPIFLKSQFLIDGPNKDYTLSNEELLLTAYRNETPPEMIEKMWSYGRYLLICASHQGGLPCPLLGLWHGDYNAFWSFNMINENLQMINWQALSGNMHELMLPVFDYFENLMEDFRLNAKSLFGCRGIYIPAVSTPYVGPTEHK